MTDSGRTSPFRGEGGRAWKRRVSPVADRPGEGPMTKPTADTRACRWELVKMPLLRHSLPCPKRLGAVVI
jgi:hypothetical protein